MRRALTVIAVFALIVAACGDDDDQGSPTTPPPAPVTTAPGPVPTTTPPAPTLPPATTGPPQTTTTTPPQSATTETPPQTTSTTAAPAPTTTAAPQITADPSLTDRFWAVVLVDGDDVLNVRTGPGISNSLLTSFNPSQTGIVLTGNKAAVDGSTWVEVETEDAKGWVNKFYLTEEWASFEVEVQWNMQGPLNVFGAAAEALADLGDPVSARGLFVVYHDEELRRWKQNELDDVMTDPTIYTWSTPGCVSCVDDTFAGAIGLPFVNVWEDISDDALLNLDDILLGGNGPFPPETAIPIQFENFHWVVIHDPGDDPELSGLDWQSWFVYYDYEDGEARIVGLSRAAWGP